MEWHFWFGEPHVGESVPLDATYIVSAKE